ncbi:hypothetical protein BT93_H2275 [Corymbia citriodora subsp. variegata]|nr:hypothetical protein BT93_H2275 [Corymbia citriodora subsp. variegata]
MEVSVIGSSQAKILKTDLACRELGLLSFKNGSGVFWRKSKISFGQSSGLRNSGVRLTLKAVQTEAIRPQKISRRQSRHGVRLYVGLPLDAVSSCNVVNHAKAIAVGLKALKLLGVEGVELPIWWGIVEKEAMGKYDWSGYLALVEMVHKVGLKLHVSLCFHGSKHAKIPLPEWVIKIGEQNPSIFFTDRAGQQYKECLSLAVDEIPVLEGKTPVEVYNDFCESFKSSFSSFIGSTINGISMGLGPDSELRYPSHQGLSRSGKVPGVGEFQCYDKSMLALLKEHGETTGNPLWGLGGPHDAPAYDASPSSNSFFKDHGGSWESPYGDYFLSWYSNLLVRHADRLLSLASSAFGDSEVAICGKVPLVHQWYKTRSHPAELTAGFYNTQNRDGYEAIAEMFARHSCKMILPGMDLSDEGQLQEGLSSPEQLLGQIWSACKKHGVEVSGENSSDTIARGGFEQIRKHLSGEDVAHSFFYQRMGAYFFSPEHFPSFTQFVRSMKQPQMHADDLLSDEEEAEEPVAVTSESGIQMQTA